MSGYSFALTCPNCGHDTAPLAGGRPIGGAEVNAVCRCSHCGSEWNIHVRLFPVRLAPDENTHGTDAAYTRHRRAGERPCPLCMDAHAAANAHPLVGAA